MLKRTRFGLLRAFLNQHGALRLSASSYDFGHLGETARIANSISILLGPKSRILHGSRPLARQFVRWRHQAML